MKGLIKRLFAPSTEVLPPEHREIARVQPRGMISTYNHGRRLAKGTNLVDAETGFVNAVDRLWDGLERLDQTKIRHARTRNKLNNIDLILQADNDELDRTAQESATALADARSREKIRASKRSLEEAQAEDELADYRAERRHTARLARQEELQARLEEVRLRNEAFKKMREDFINERGGEKNLTNEERDDLKKGEKAHEEYIKASEVS